MNKILERLEELRSQSIAIRKERNDLLEKMLKHAPFAVGERVRRTALRGGFTDVVVVSRVNATEDGRFIYRVFPLKKDGSPSKKEHYVGMYETLEKITAD